MSDFHSNELSQSKFYLLKLEQIKLLTLLKFFLRENATLSFKLVFLSMTAPIYYVCIYIYIYITHKCIIASVFKKSRYSKAKKCFKIKFYATQIYDRFSEEERERF